MRWSVGWCRWCGLACLGLGLLAGCGPRPGAAVAAAPLVLDPDDGVTDEDIVHALKAAPQLPMRLRVALFATDDTYAAALERALLALPEVHGVYRIPPLLASGQRRSDGPRRRPVTLGSLRLLAARARADVVLIADYGHQTEYRANGLSVFGLAVLPLFVLPIQDVETTSYADGYLVDTRNGYLYGQVGAELRDTEDYVTIYSSAGETLVAAQRKRLVAQTSSTLSGLIEKQQVASQRYRAGSRRAGTAPLPIDTADPWAPPDKPDDTPSTSRVPKQPWTAPRHDGTREPWQTPGRPDPSQ